MERKTILCIDDDPDDRILLLKELKEVNDKVEVAEAENGLQALDYLNDAAKNNTLPCLIVLDLNMPVMDGRQTFQRIHNDNKLQRIPLVVYTSSSNPSDKAFFTTKGIKYFTKPSSQRVLKDIAKDMVSECG